MSVIWPVPLLLFSLAGCAYMIRIAVTTGLYTDFVMLYDSARALHEGSAVYTHEGAGTTDFNLNPPHVAALMLPLARLSLEHAAMVMWAVIGLSMALVAVLLRRGLSPWWVLATMAVVLASPGGYLSVRFINLAWPLALGITWAWLEMRNQRPASAGAALGVLASIKPFFLLFLPWLVWRRQWRAVSAFALGGLAAMALGLAVAGPDAYRSWLNQFGTVAWQGNSLNVSIAGALRRNLDAGARGGFTPLLNAPPIVTPLWLLASLAMVATMWATFRRRYDVDREWASMLVACLLISPLGWSYYWPIVAGPVAAAFAKGRITALSCVAIALCLLPFLVLPYGQPSALLTATLATAYSWGGLLLWWQVTTLRDSRPVDP